MVLTQRQPAETARRPAAPASGPWLVQRGGRFVQVTELLALPQRQPAETARRPAAPASGPPPVPSGGVDDVDDVDTLPERPALAPQVVLSGELKDAGFAHQQWLVQRGGRFVQVTELLYRILERADGQRTLDEIAAGVSQAIGRGVSADQVGHLIARKLIPAGLVAGAPGPLGPAPDAVGRGWMRSPLAVNLRLRVVGPDHIERVTRVLQVLYLPPVLVAVLAAVAAAHGWLYFGHGIGGSARAAVDTPGLMVVVLGAIVLSAAFHEFGHAAALRYGGGRVRGMGVGLYLVYPVFYTDVTDSYRLGRWARVRTDLGGLYFNLIFTLGVMALYAATGQEFLLLIVAVIDLEIVHQLLPLVRLDGYWLLADLTGLPDFFSQMGPFVRSLLPIPGWHERTLPPLKRWVKAVFGLYILVVVPLLGLLLLLTVKNLPHALTTAGDSFRRLAGAFAGAQATGDLLGAAAVVPQMVALALPTIGLALVLANLGGQAARALWRWSSPTPARRTVGALVAAGAAVLVALLWAP